MATIVNRFGGRSQGTFSRLFVSEARQSVCPECSGAKLVCDYGRAELVCATCGFVIYDKIIDPGPEWRAYQEQGKSSIRTGPPPSLMRHDKGLTTDISPLNRGTMPGQREKFRRLRKLQTRARVADGTELRLARMLSEVERLSSQLSLPRNIREAAALVCRESSKRFTRLPSFTGVAAAALLIACRERGLPRTFAEVQEAAGLRERELRRSYVKVTRKLGIRPFYSASCRAYIIRYGTDLAHLYRWDSQECGEVQRRAGTLAEKMAKSSHGMSPKAVAAALLYIACIENGLRCTQRDLANVIQMTEVTVRNAYKKIRASLESRHLMA